MAVSRVGDWTARFIDNPPEAVWVRGVPVAGVANVRLVHGKGTGALRKAVRGLLSEHPLVESYRDGEPGEGGAGATVAALKVS